MTVITIILGVLLAACGFSCMCTPLLTFMEMGYFVAILFLIYGIMEIVKAISDKEYGVNFLFAILTVIAGMLVLFIPQLRAVTDGMLLYVAATWFIIQGLVTMFLALNAKRVVRGKKWIWGIILGIIGIILGIYSFVHPVVLAMSIGILIGVYFVVTGINMIVLAVQIKQ